MTNDPAERNADAAQQPQPVEPTVPAAPQPATDNPATASLADRLRPLLTDLYYPSESDEPVSFVTCYLSQDAPLTEVQIREWQLLPPSVYVEEKPVAEFWEPVITPQDWYGDEETNRTASFQQLKALLDDALTQHQFFRQGDTEITLYLLGRLADGTRAGLQTMAVES